MLMHVYIECECTNILRSYVQSINQPKSVLIIIPKALKRHGILISNDICMLGTARIISASVLIKADSCGLLVAAVSATLRKKS